MNTLTRKRTSLGTGPGWAVTDGDRVLPGRWATEEDAAEEGYLGVYLLSGVDVVKVDE